MAHDGSRDGASLREKVRSPHTWAWSGPRNGEQAIKMEWCMLLIVLL